jgi:hypothetical protein
MNCEATIARECVLATIDRDSSSSIGPTRQTIKAYCEHCSTMMELKRELRGGVWCMLDQPAIVADKKKKAGFLARIEHQRNILRAQAG